jgi:hypothetical protein
MKDDKSKGMKKGRGIPGLDVIKLLGAIPALIITLIGAISFKLFSSLLRKISKIETLKLTLIIFLFFISIFSLVIAGYLTLLQGIIILTMIFLLSLLPPMFHLAAHIHEFYESLPISDFFARKSSVLLIIPILFILIIVGNATLHYTESPEFCVTCHLMTPYYISYQSSQH